MQATVTKKTETPAFSKRKPNIYYNFSVLTYVFPVET